MAPLSFKFAQTPSLDARQTQIGGAAGGGLLGNPGEINENTLNEAGFNFASSELPPEYQFSRMGGWNVSFRASVIRISFMKLLGTGIAAMLAALSPYTGRYTSFSCALAAAVNFIACFHYWFIWNIRKQIYGGPRYQRWMARVGRVPEEDTALLKDEVEHDARAVYWQELAVDGLRHSDWLCTLVLMTLDLGHFREYLTAVTAGAVPALRISKEWLATMQSLMIFSATFWRFYFNEGRSTRRADGGVVGPKLFAAVSAWTSFAVSSGLFAVVVWGLLVDLPAVNTITATSVQSDIIVLRVLVLVWVGYPIVALAARLGHLGVAGDRYSATWSLIKDVSFSFLDITAKAGLAIFFVLKSAWLDAAQERALLDAAKKASIG